MEKGHRGPMVETLLRSAGARPEFGDVDWAALGLARVLAEKIDAGTGDLARLACQYRQILAELGLTPASRTRMTGKGGGGGGEQQHGGPGRLDELRARRASRTARAG